MAPAELEAVVRADEVRAGPRSRAAAVEACERPMAPRSTRRARRSGPTAVRSSPAPGRRRARNERRRRATVAGSAPIRAVEGCPALYDLPALVAGGERDREVRADEPGAPCDEHPHRPRPSAPLWPRMRTASPKGRIQREIGRSREVDTRGGESTAVGRQPSIRSGPDRTAGAAEGGPRRISCPRPCGSSC